MSTQSSTSLFSKLGFFPTLIVVASLLAILATAGQGIIMLTMKLQQEQMLSQLELEKKQIEIEKMRESAKPHVQLGSEKFRSGLITTVNCGENSDDANRTLAKLTQSPQELAPSTAYVVENGCAAVHITGAVKSISGGRYLFQQESDPEQYGCGTFGMTDGARTDTQCAAWVNAHVGQTLRLIVDSGNTVTIKIKQLQP